MVIKLQKGQRISLKKEAPKLEQLMCGLGWDVAKKKGGFLGSLFTTNCDLDASVLCLNEQDKIESNKDMIYFGHLVHASSAIQHMGDNLTGQGAGDDEQIIVKLPLVPSSIHKLVFVVNIYNAFERKQDFSQVENAFVRLVNIGNNNQEIARFTLSGNQYQNQTGLIMAEISRTEDDWEVTAKGEGIRVSSLSEITQLYS